MAISLFLPDIAFIPKSPSRRPRLSVSGRRRCVPRAYFGSGRGKVRLRAVKGDDLLSGSINGYGLNDGNTGVATTSRISNGSVGNGGGNGYYGEEAVALEEREWGNGSLVGYVNRNGVADSEREPTVTGDDLAEATEMEVLEEEEEWRKRRIEEVGKEEAWFKQSGGDQIELLDFRQRKCNVIFDLSCNLARLLEFCTREIPQAFLSGSDTNLRRLTEIIVFSLNHVSSPTYAEFFSLQSSERGNKGMLLTPLVGIILNLLDASRHKSCKVDLFHSDVDEAKLAQIEGFAGCLLRESERREAEDAKSKEQRDSAEEICCICYESRADAKLMPCSHKSCYGCISRHLLNCQRCFFCNAIVSNIRSRSTTFHWVCMMIADLLCSQRTATAGGISVCSRQTEAALGLRPKWNSEG